MRPPSYLSPVVRVLTGVLRLARRASGSWHFSIRLSDSLRSRVSACLRENRIVFCGSKPRKVYLVRRRGPSTDSRMKQVSNVCRMVPKRSIGSLLVSRGRRLSLEGVVVSGWPKAIPHDCRLHIGACM
jgi:hypothetical protein